MFKFAYRNPAMSCWDVRRLACAESYEHHEENARASYGDCTDIVWSMQSWAVIVRLLSDHAFHEE